MEETWMRVPEFENYIVSNFGNVYNTKHSRIVEGRRHRDGSIKVVLSQDGRRYDTSIHTLVYRVFFLNYRQGSPVIHQDGDKTNNFVGNLTQADPQEYYKPPGFQPGDDSKTPVEIIETGDVFPNVEVLSKVIDGDKSTIYKCLRGQRTSHKGYTFRFTDYVELMEDVG